MKKRIVSFLLILVILFSFMPAAIAYSNTAYNSAEALFKLGLFKGTGTNSDGSPIFELDRTPTRAEAIVMLVRLLGKENEANAGSWETPFYDVEDWALPYVGYAYQSGLTQGNGDGSFGSYENVTTSQYLTFVLRALGYTSGTDFQWDSAWTLSDTIGLTDGTYNAKTSFTRGDTAVISHGALSRRLKGSNATLLSELSANGAVTLEAVKSAGLNSLISSIELSAEDVYEKCSPAIFFIEVHYDSGSGYSTGSGFFIESHGVAVTNFHVIEGAKSAFIRTSDGKEHKVLGVYDYDTEKDLALIKVEGEGFPTVELSYSDTLKVGSQVYAIGSPEGLENTMSKGMVSYLKRTLYGHDYIQSDAPVTHGSSGGALLDKYGSVIGVTTAGLEGDSYINFSVPAKYINGLSRASYTPLSDNATTGKQTPFSFSSAVPSFGNYFGVRDSDIIEKAENRRYYYYKEALLPQSAVSDYSALLEKHGFSRTSFSSTDNKYEKDGVSVKVVRSTGSTGTKYIVIDITVSEAAVKTYPAVEVGYAENKAVPDLGAFYGVSAKSTATKEDYFVYEYSKSDFNTEDTDTEVTYGNLLKKWGFTLSQYLQKDSVNEYYYVKDLTEVRIIENSGANLISLMIYNLTAPASEPAYSSFAEIPDFGKCFGITLRSSSTSEGTMYYYSMSAASAKAKRPLSAYCRLLVNWGFSCIDAYTEAAESTLGSIYEKGYYTLFVGTKVIDGEECIAVGIYDNRYPKVETGCSFSSSVPDFGAYFGIESFYQYTPSDSSTAYYYKKADALAVTSDAMSDYYALIRKWGFTYSYAYSGDSELRGSYYTKGSITLFVGFATAEGEEFIIIGITK